MKNLDHPNLITLVEFLDDIDFKDYRGEICKVSALVLENASNSTLLNLLSSFDALTEIHARTYFHQLINAIEYLHDKNIAHRDIKPENILLDEKFCIKLADFGHSLDLAKSNCTTRAGTSQYFAPEMLANGDFNPKKADLFAAGIILFCMIAGSMPFNEAAPEDRLYKKLIQGNAEEFWSFHEQVCCGSSERVFGAELRDLLEKMFHPNPEKRLSLKELKQHPWYLKDTIEDNKIEALLKQL